MTLAHANGNRRRPAKSGSALFWVLAARFLALTLALISSGYVSGYGMAARWSKAVTFFPRACVPILAVSFIAAWVPLGIYYEGHRFRWVYIVMVALLTLILAWFVGHGTGSAR